MIAASIFDVRTTATLNTWGSDWMQIHKSARLILILAVLILGHISVRVGAQGDATPPILVITNATAPNKYGGYLGEILRAEGLNSYDSIDILGVNASLLAPYKVVILAQTPLTSAEALTLRNYVVGGGALIAMRPDTQIADLFGLGAPAGAQPNGYLQINTGAVVNGQTPGFGLASQTLQIHGEIDRYSTLPGAVILAQLYSNATTATSYPAVVSSASGTAFAFTYDLPSNIVYMRQGNPANANVDTDGDGVLRTIDLFQTTGGGAPWVNRDRIPIPQADEQQRLFARLVQQAVSASHPLPQLWYFPGTAKTMLISTGDAHANPLSWHQDIINVFNTYGAKITFYLSIASQPDDMTVQLWRSQGHDVGIHPYAYHNDSYDPYDIENLDEGYTVYSTWFDLTFSNAPSLTVRHHQVAWLGWTDAAEIAANHGYRLDTNFYHWGSWLQKSDGSWPHGYITGSGQPMKFIRDDGAILPYFQQLTQLVDEQLLTGFYENLDTTQAVAVARQLIDASQAGDYAALMNQIHVDYRALGWVQGMLAYAHSQGVPSWNAAQWLTFTDTRYATNYSNIAWNGVTLTFQINGPATPGIYLTTMLPLSYNGQGVQSLSVDGLPATYSVQTIKGVETVFVSVPAGNHTFSVVYQGPVQTPTPTFTPTATSTPTQTPTNTPTATYTPSVTWTPSSTSMPTLSPTASNTPLPVPPPFTAAPTLTPSATPSPLPTLTPTPVPTATHTAYLEPSPTATYTPLPSPPPFG